MSFKSDYNPLKVRRLTKKVNAQSIFASEWVRKVANLLIEVDDRLIELANLEFEVTSDNLLSKAVRQAFKIKRPLETPTAIRDKAAKSKWHEIVKRAENVAENQEYMRRTRERIVQELSGALVEQTPEDLKNQKAPKEEAFDIYEELKRSTMK